MYSRLTRAKIGHGELIRITDDLAMSEMTIVKEAVAPDAY